MKQQLLKQKMKIQLKVLLMMEEKLLKILKNLKQLLDFMNIDHRF